MRWIVVFWLASLVVAYGAGVAAEQDRNWAAFLFGFGALLIVVVAVIPASKQKRA